MIKWGRLYLIAFMQVPLFMIDTKPYVVKEWTTTEEYYEVPHCDLFFTKYQL